MVIFFSFFFFLICLSKGCIKQAVVSPLTASFSFKGPRHIFYKQRGGQRTKGSKNINKKIPESWPVMALGCLFVVIIVPGLLSGYSLPVDLMTNWTRSGQYPNSDEHIFLPLQVPLRNLDLIQMWCRTSKTSDASFCSEVTLELD